MSTAVSDQVLASLLVEDGSPRPDPASADDADRALRAILRAARVHLGMQVGFVSEFTETHRVFRSVDAAVPTPVRPGGGDPLEETYCQRVVDGRLPPLIRDARAEPAAAELPVTAALPVGAHVSVPIVLSDGTVYGTFCCFSSSPDHSLTQRDLAVMRAFAEVAAGLIERERDARRRRRELRARILDALRGDALSLVYQPLVDLEAARPAGFEALARFREEPPRGPAAWFAEARSAGLGEALELEAVVRAVRDLPELPGEAYLAVNLSAATVLGGGVEGALAAAPLDRVVVEITEHSPVPSYERLRERLDVLRSGGLRVAVDDAGAGYASFTHILRLAPDLIKLDMGLTRGIDADPAKRHLAAALVRFARETGGEIVAEGVETAEELEALRALGVRFAQGFHLGRPEPLASLRRRWTPP